MCGLVAMVTKMRHGFNQNNTNFFDHLLFIDTIRGEDSTGVFVVDNIGNVQLAKDAQQGPDFIKTKEYKDLRSLAIQRGWAMVGHNRKATRGTINDENAHPFWVDDRIVLVHNGTMHGDHKKHADVEVDSHAIAHVLDKEENIEAALQKINAAYALIWYNVAQKKLNFIRNAQRPLAWCETQTAFYFASERDMLEYVAKRTNTEIISKGKEGFPQAWEMIPNTLDVWELKQDKSTEVKSHAIDANYKVPANTGTSTETSTWQGWVENGKGTWEYSGKNTKHPYACAYDTEDECGESTSSVLGKEEMDELRASINTQNEIARLRALASTSTHRTFDAVAKVPTPMPDWAQQGLYFNWMTMKKDYHTGNYVRVLAKDYLADSANPQTVWMTGVSMDSNALFCVFPVHKEIFDRITASGSSYMADGKALFTVEIDLVGWKRLEAAPMPASIDQAEGHPYIVGKGSKPIITLGAGNA